MKTKILLTTVISLSCLTLRGQSPEDQFTQKFNQGFEPAIVLEDHGSDDGEVSVIFSARKPGLGPAKWPSILADVSINGTDVDVDNSTTENWIVSLRDQARLGLVKSADPDFRAYYPERHRHELSALWGPNQEGWHYGVLNYSGYWACDDIFFVNSDGVEATVTSMKSQLDRATTAAVAAQGKNPQDYQITYELLEFVNPQDSVVVTDPITLSLRTIAQIPQDDEADPIEGTLLVRLSRDERGVASATLIPAGGSDQVAAPVSSVPSEEEFSAWREQSRQSVKAGTWKAVKKDLATDGPGHTKFVTGWLEAYVLQQMTRVDSRGDDDEIVASYFWRDGLLYSIVKFATGSHTGNKEIKRSTDTFNFHEGRLVSWTSSISGLQDPDQRGFQELGAALQEEAQSWSDPIYEAVGAD